MVATRRPVIVYVEDNTGDALLLREALLERQYDVELVVIERGDKALHYLEIKASARDIPPPHCVLLDSHLPIITGVQLVQFLRSQSVFNTTPVYLFASRKEYEEVKDTVHIAEESFLQKPQEWTSFLRLADTLMRSSRAAEAHSPLPPGEWPEHQVPPDPALRLRVPTA